MVQQPIVVNRLPEEVSPEKRRKSRNLGTANSGFKMRRISQTDNEGKPFYGPPRFMVNTWKSEQERIEEAMKKNVYLMTEPINKAAGEHVFRDRNIQREIQPKMCFSRAESRRSTPSTSLSKRRSVSTMRQFFEEPKEIPPINKIYFKAAIDMYMQNGCMKAETFGEKGIFIENRTTPVETHKNSKVLKLHKIKDIRLNNIDEDDLENSENFNDYKAKKAEIDNLFVNPYLLAKNGKNNDEMTMAEKARAIEYLRSSCKNSKNNTPDMTPTRPTKVRFLESLRKSMSDINKEDMLIMAKHILLKCNVENQKSQKNPGFLKRGDGVLVCTARSANSSKMRPSQVLSK